MLQIAKVMKDKKRSESTKGLRRGDTAAKCTKPFGAQNRMLVQKQQYLDKILCLVSGCANANFLG